MLTSHEVVDGDSIGNTRCTITSGPEVEDFSVMDEVYFSLVVEQSICHLVIVSNPDLTLC